MKNKARISIRIPEELKAKLKDLANRLKTTSGEIARKGIEKQVNKLKRKGK